MPDIKLLCNTRRNGGLIEETFEPIQVVIQKVKMVSGAESQKVIEMSRLSDVDKVELTYICSPR